MQSGPSPEGGPEGGKNGNKQTDHRDEILPTEPRQHQLMKRGQGSLGNYIAWDYRGRHLTSLVMWALHTGLSETVAKRTGFWGVPIGPHSTRIADQRVTPFAVWASTPGCPDQTAP